MSVFSGLKQAVHRGHDALVARRAPETFGALADRLLVLNYHRVLPRDFAELSIVEPGMYVFEDTFRMHLTEALLHFEAVDLTQWIDTAGRDQSSRRPAFAVTFDDGWRDNHDFALPVLRELGVPATVFVVSELAGTDRSFWPERLARRLKSVTAADVEAGGWLYELMQRSGLDSGNPTADQISRAIALAKHRSDEAIHAELDALDDRLGATGAAGGRDLASWEELQVMAASGLVALGSHTRHHVRLLPDLSEDSVASEVQGSCNDIERHTGKAPSLFCYPNGDVSPLSRQLVERHYRGACTTERGWNSRDGDPYALRRVALHEDRSATREAFLARLVQAA